MIDLGSGARNPANRKFTDNKIKTTKYSFLTFLPKNLFEQFHRFANLYFLFIVVLNFMPMVGCYCICSKSRSSQIEAFGRLLSCLPITFVLSVTAIKDAFEDFRRYKSDEKINKAICRVWDK